MSNEIIIEAMASDLKRVALGLQRGSHAMAQRFSTEALARSSEVDIDLTPSYIIEILDRIAGVLSDLNKDRSAEDCLMYATILQNYSSQQLLKV